MADVNVNYKNILVPVDGSKEAEAALGKAIQVAIRNGEDANLHILHVIDTRAFQNVTDFKTTMVEQVAETAKKTLDAYLQQAKNAGVQNVDYTIEYGSPKDIIAHQAPEKLNADLIMIGATGLNAIERLLIGSVTEYVTRTANVDTLIVRAK
ncbi:universal stress protein [Weissella cibaria]|jgi:Universal stress protein UspA and related nucleotide-binding proteins|uniref:universal stress protein n=1 Tax=Weissella cibaria TaxID=137591 RepID=UPI000E527324|nr:universal stress protein [Weissella cibaria]MCQ9619881.1 universal stress protein [Weissella cibaria]RGO79683.1 universal stress protein [Weissella cibaria]RHE72672.1 universal stress protein [Weissella cibaria]RHE79034.1 universal stress protein [Weissella cibaria]